MERPRVAPKAPFSLGERSADIGSWPAQHESRYGDFSSLTGYRSSLSLYDRQAPFHSEHMALDEDGHRGGYPHLSSYRDEKSVEPSVNLSLYNGLGHGPGHLEGFYHRSSYGDYSSIGTSLHRYESASSHQNTDTGFSGQYTADQYRHDGLSYGNRHDDFPHQQIVGMYQPREDHANLYRNDLAYPSKLDNSLYEHSAASYQHSAVSQKHDLAYPLKEPNMHYQHSAGRYQYQKDDGTGAAYDYERHSLENSGLEIQYASSAGMYESAGAMGERMDTGSGSAYKGHQGEEDGSSRYGGWLRDVQARYTKDEAGSRFKVMDGGITAELEHRNKMMHLMHGTRDGSSRLTQPVMMPLDLDKGKSASMIHMAMPGTGDGDSKEGSRQVEGAGSAKEATGGKKRQSRWEPQPEGEGEAQDSTSKQKKKSRWSPEMPSSGQINLTDFMKEFSGGLNLDHEFLALKVKLVDINRKLLTGQVVEDKPDGIRSPSPVPVYDNFGYRINTREYRAREKLTRERQSVLAKLLEKCPSFKVPSEVKCAKLSRKVYIPVEQYPDYNFIGLIIGPRGLTQKRMEKESGSKIFIRGKGSVKEGSSHTITHDENDKLHVLIEADSEDSLNIAVGMVEKLLVPVRDGHNELKRAQLRELATLNGTLRANELCHFCKEPGHYSKACPLNGSRGPTSAVPEPQKGDSLQSGSEGHVLNASNVIRSGPLVIGGGSSGGIQSLAQHGTDLGLNKGTGDTHIYVANLPLSIDDAGLLSLFSPFGNITYARVITDHTSGVSKGYGFINFLDAADAAQAVALMNGYGLDGRVLFVKFKTSTEAGASGLLPLLQSGSARVT